VTRERVNGGSATGVEDLQEAPRRAFRTAAVIVTYNPGPNLKVNLAVLRRQVDELVIVDNGSVAAGQEMIVQAASSSGCCTVFNGRNLGIGAALNMGMKFASDEQCYLVLLLDQDSAVSDDYVRDIEASYLSALADRVSSDRTVGMIVPTYVDERTGATMPLTSYPDGTVLSGMTSGSLIPMDTYKICGGFEEDFFIDYVDIEYCLRLQDRGFSIVQSQDAVLMHSLGTLRAHRLGGVGFSSTNHSAARRYYISRNRTALHLRYLLRRPRWVGRDLWAMAMETGKIVLVEEDRGTKLWCTLRGLFDGITGRSGYRAEL
jgi:rhamnosyltransferase